MTYSGISVKDVINNINNEVGGWFLPAVQRPYVWGSRYENEEYICKLFDSILRGYPIGGLIVWKTPEKIPYREFVHDYRFGKEPRLADEGRWGKKDKCLIYDGQQRLQTLYSCLKYSFNGKILSFDLLFDSKSEHEPTETGFLFREKEIELLPNLLRMSELFSKSSEDYIDFEEEILSRNDSLEKKQKKIIRNNLHDLWKAFIETSKDSLAYFEIKESEESEVNEIFERLNSGGMSLSLSDYLFSHIKGKKGHHDFEEKLQIRSKTIFNQTGKGYVFDAYNILQLSHLLVKGAVRVDPRHVNTKELDEFAVVSSENEEPLTDFFVKYIWGSFKINDKSIIPSNNAMLPILVYFCEIYKKGFKYKHLTAANKKIIDCFFIKSQINDWSLQTYVNTFSKIVRKESSDAGSNIFDFPLEKIEEKIVETGKREIGINEQRFVDKKWFTLKIMTPNRVYEFDRDSSGRFNPELDHIFPVKLPDQDDAYKEQVDILWNMQPVSGEINVLKTNIHPVEFFTDMRTDSSGNTITGSKYLNDYDFLFPKDDTGKIDFSDVVWANHNVFIRERREKMLNFMKTKYDISVSVS